MTIAEERACIFRAILPATEVVCITVELKILFFSPDNCCLKNSEDFPDAGPSFVHFITAPQFQIVALFGSNKGTVHSRNHGAE